jgi:triosephosphate isomerase
MRKKIVAGNWKMNLDADAAGSLYQDLLNKSFGKSDGKMTIVFPPNIYLQDFINRNNGSFHLGAQNFNAKDNGAYTGEVSASQLKSIGCLWVLVGHSERRVLFNEDDEVLLDKMKTALKHGLNVIYCCGESSNERESFQHKSKIQSQLALLKAFSLEQIKSISIAYEPIWAIGTGKTASPLQAAEMHDFIREELKILFGSETSNHTSILYGGSCSPTNAEALFQCQNIDGGLIGGAALDADSFRSIIESLK